MHEENSQSNRSKLKTKLHYPPTTHLGEHRRDNELLEYRHLRPQTEGNSRRHKRTDTRRALGPSRPRSHRPPLQPPLPLAEEAEGRQRASDVGGSMSPHSHTIPTSVPNSELERWQRSSPCARAHGSRWMCIGASSQTSPSWHIEWSKKGHLRNLWDCGRRWPPATAVCHGCGVS